MIAIYVRVSSEKQRQKGHSINEQIERAEHYIQNNFKGQQYTVYNDAGFSASTMNRPALKKLLNDITLSNLDTVIFLHIDRISRDVLDSAYFVQHCNLHNVRIVCLLHPVDISTPEGKMNFQFSTVFAEFERAQISRRTKFGLHGGLSKGLYSIGGAAPFGYIRKKNTLLIDDTTSKVVIDIFTHFATSTISLYALCQHYKNAPLMSNGKKVPHHSIKNILKNKIYIGKVTVDNQTYTVAPRIISDELFDKVQNKLSKQSHTYPSNTYLFSNKLLCTHCKKKLVNKSTYKKAKRYLYYACTTKNCVAFNKRINENILYDQLHSTLRKLIHSKYNSDLDFNNQEIKQKIKNLKIEITNEETRGKTALLKLIDGIISDHDFKFISKEVHQHIRFLKDEINTLKHKIIKPSVSLESLKKQHVFHFLQNECPLFEVDLIHKKCITSKSSTK